MNVGIEPFLRFFCEVRFENGIVQERRVVVLD
jgi:hypothetical protein